MRGTAGLFGDAGFCTSYTGYLESRFYNSYSSDHNHNHVSHYRQYEIEMPMQLKDSPGFERENNISVSVYGWEPEKKNKEGELDPGYAFTLRIAEEVKPNHVNLLVIGDEVKHYCWSARSILNIMVGSPTVTFVYTGSLVKLLRDNVRDSKTLNVDGMSMRRSASDMEGKNILS